MFAFQDVAEEATRLIATCEQNREAPFYSESTFSRRLRYAAQRQSRIPFRSRDPGVDYLRRQEWQRIVDRARLTPKQQAVIVARLNGWTFEEIGRRFGHTKQAAQNVFRQAAAKLVRAWNDEPLTGMADAYREDLKRGSRGPVQG